jgi:hypothetical protein
MKRYLLALVIFLSSGAAYAQLENNPEPKKKDWTKVDLSKRSSDHLLLQFGYSGWDNKPDSINVHGFSRSFNMYFFFDFPFKTMPKISVALGAGVGTDNIFFDNTIIDIKGGKEVIFKTDTVSVYKKYKLATGYFEIPLELRYSSNPENMNKGFKFALGAKVGLAYDAHVKAKVDRDVRGIGGYIYKEKDTRFFNNSRIVATMRVGYGNFTAFGTYALTQVFNSGSGPAVKPFTVGLTLSGL